MTTRSLPRVLGGIAPLQWAVLAGVYGFYVFEASLTVISAVRLNAPLCTAETLSPASHVLAQAILYVPWLLVSPVVVLGVARIPIERHRLLRRLGLHLALALATAVGIAAAIYLLYDALVCSFGDVSTAELLSWALYPNSWGTELFHYLALLAIGVAVDYALRYRERELEATRLQAQLAEARLRTLRTQLNPHFLYNALNTVSALVERDPAATRRVVARLSDLLRRSLETADEQRVALERELDFATGYLEIMKIRLEERLEIERDIDPAALHALVPAFLLQPLLENALKHGLARIHRRGRLTLTVRRQGDRLHLSVADNGPGLDDPGRGTQGIGLSNIRQRLRYLYGSGASLRLHNLEGGGCCVALDLPFQQGTPAALDRSFPEPAPTF